MRVEKRQSAKGFSNTRHSDSQQQQQQQQQQQHENKQPNNIFPNGPQVTCKQGVLVCKCFARCVGKACRQPKPRICYTVARWTNPAGPNRVPARHVLDLPSCSIPAFSRLGLFPADEKGPRPL